MTCFSAVDYGLWAGGVGADISWSLPGEDTKLGRMLNLDKLNLKFKLVDREHKLWGGTWIMAAAPRRRC